MPQYIARRTCPDGMKIEFQFDQLADAISLIYTWRVCGFSGRRTLWKVGRDGKLTRVRAR